MKKIMLISLLCTSAYVYGMDATIDYKRFFELCKKGVTRQVKVFIQQNPAININYQNEHGTTPLLHAATWGKWDVVLYLLRMCGAHKMLPDNYGQTLFSKAVYDCRGSCWFKKIVHYYSLGEIHFLCKTIPLKRNMDNPAKIVGDGVYFKAISEALSDQSNINNQDGNGRTVLHTACTFKAIPLIIRLLESGADLDIKDRWGSSVYNGLSKDGDDKAPLFVVREICNNGPCIPTALIYEAANVIEKHTPPGCARYIKQLYVAEKLSEKPFESPKARIWKPVCKDVCKILKIDSTDEKRCLTTVLLLPQRKLTDVNIQLALADK